MASENALSADFTKDDDVEWPLQEGNAESSLQTGIKYFPWTDRHWNKAQASEPAFSPGISTKKAYGNQKDRRHQTCKGVERFDPFDSMHYEKDESAPTKWIDILEGRAGATLPPL